MAEVLESDDADEPLLIHYRNHREAARGDFAKGGGERLALVADIDDTIHDRLHVAIAFGANRIDDALPRNRTYEIAAPNNREVILQGV